MKTLLERFLDYISYDTQSDDNSGTHPSTPGQRVLAEHLADDLRQLGLVDVQVSEYAYVYGKLPASPDCQQEPPLGFIAHMDTASEASGKNVRPQIIRNWDGKLIHLGQSDLSIQPPQAFIGKTIITTDGTTLLGADDKAGIAIIMTALQNIIQNNLPHRTLCIAFTPDEEIGAGATFFDVDAFGACFAYTLDGGDIEIIENQNFNTASANVSIRGISVHPGSSFGKMINAQKVAMEFDAMLPPDEIPAKTQDMQGFFHLCQSTGNVSSATLNYIIRDFDEDNFNLRKQQMLDIADKLNEKYGERTVSVVIADQYFNMKRTIDQCPFLIENAQKALEANGLSPKLSAIRGGTDGAHLAEMGVVCPNLGDGGFDFHGEQEYAVLEQMEQMAAVVAKLAELTRS